MISIIIPTLNSEKTIVRAIVSCQRQKYKKIEIIVIDNGSSDKTLDLVKEKMIEDSRIELLFSNKGRSIARNVGIKNASGEFIQFLDADDEIDEQKLNRAMKLFLLSPKTFAVCSSWKFVNDRNGKSERNTHVLNGKFDLALGNIYPINSIVFKKSNTILFDENLEFNEDWLFWYKNLYNKKMDFDREYVGAIIHVTGNNTMAKLDKMVVGQYLVRSLIKKKSRVRSVASFFNDLKICLKYVYFSEQGVLKLSSERCMRLVLIVAQIAFKVPFIRLRLIKKIQFGIQVNKYV